MAVPCVEHVAVKVRDFEAVYAQPGVKQVEGKPNNRLETPFGLIVEVNKRGIEP